MTRALRVLKLAQLAAARRGERAMPTREELARLLGVSPRTISRDFAVLEEAHIPLKRADGHD